MARRSSKIYTEITQDSAVFQGQALPGSQRPLPRSGSSMSVTAGAEMIKLKSFREGTEDSADSHSARGSNEAIPMFSESNQPPLPNRRKSAVGVSLLPADALDLSIKAAETADELSSGPGKSLKARRKSKASLSINTNNGNGVVDLRPDSSKAPMSAKGLGVPSTPNDRSVKIPVLMKDTNKRASSRLILDKQKSVARNMDVDDDPVPVAPDEGKGKNVIDFDTCCIFIF